MKRLLSLIFTLLLCMSFLGCESDWQDAQIAATTLPVYEFTARLCEGTGITVTRLITESVSCLHDYTLQVSQMRSIEAAELIVISGAGLEDFLEDTLHSTQKVIDSSANIALLCSNESEEHTHEETHGHSHEHDPHIWLSPANAKAMSRNIYQGLMSAYPEYAEIFTENLAALEAKFDALADYAETELRTLSCRELITFHDGFAYMAEAFELNIVHAIEEESGSEASAAELIELTQIVTDHQLGAVFVEYNSSSAAASVISAETGISVHQLDMAMASGSYFDAMYHNIDTLKEALG